MVAAAGMAAAMPRARTVWQHPVSSRDSRDGKRYQQQQELKAEITPLMLSPTALALSLSFAFALSFALAFPLAFSFAFLLVRRCPVMV